MTIQLRYFFYDDLFFILNHLTALHYTVCKIVNWLAKVVVTFRRPRPRKFREPLLYRADTLQLEVVKMFQCITQNTA